MISTLCPKFKVLQLFPFSFFSTKFPARGDRIQIQFGDKWAPWRTEQIVDLIKVKHKAPTYTYRFYRIHQIWVKGEIPPSFGHFRYHWEFAPPPQSQTSFGGFEPPWTKSVDPPPGSGPWIGHWVYSRPVLTVYLWKCCTHANKKTTIKTASRSSKTMNLLIKERIARSSSSDMFEGFRQNLTMLNSKHFLFTMNMCKKGKQKVK